MEFEQYRPYRILLGLTFKCFSKTSLMILTGDIVIMFLAMEIGLNTSKKNNSSEPLNIVIMLFNQRSVERQEHANSQSHSVMISSISQEFQTWMRLLSKKLFLIFCSQNSLKIWLVMTFYKHHLLLRFGPKPQGYYVWQTAGAVLWMCAMVLWRIIRLISKHQFIYHLFVRAKPFSSKKGLFYMLQC